AVREAAALEEMRAGELRDELRQQAGLADPGVPVDRYELRGPLAGDPGRERAQDDELLLPADHLRGETLDAPGARQRDDGSRLPGRERGSLPLRLRRPESVVAIRASRRTPRPLADQHLSRLGTLLQTSR